MNISNLLHRIFVENAYYKFFSLALTVLLYIWVLGDRDSDVTLNTSLRLAIPENMVLVNQPKSEVELTLSGRWTALERLTASNNIPPMLVELDGRQGEEILRLNESMIQLPPTLRVKSIRPSFISINMQPRQEKRVSITPRFIGELPQGYQLGQIKITPSTTSINGPSEAIAKLNTIQTEAIDLSSHRQDFATQVRLQHSSSLVRDDLQDMVQVTVEVNSLEQEKTFKNLPVMALNTTLKTTVTPSTVDITLKGPKKLIENFNPSGLLISVDMSKEENQPDGLFKKPVVISNLPRDIKLVNHYPTDFMVKTSRPATGSGQ